MWLYCYMKGWAETTHIWIHKGVKYGCKQCDYKVVQNVLSVDVINVIKKLGHPCLGPNKLWQLILKDCLPQGPISVWTVCPKDKYQYGTVYPKDRYQYGTIYPKDTYKYRTILPQGPNTYEPNFIVLYTFSYI